MLAYKLRINWFNLDYTFDSGQVFRWRKISNGWEGIIEKRWVRLEQKGDEIWLYTVEKESKLVWFYNYIRYTDPWDELQEWLAQNLPSLDIIKNFWGLRLLKQDPWETLASFILSTNRNIRAIANSIEKLCNRFGDLVPAISTLNWYTFPEPKVLATASVEELLSCRVGYRAEFLQKAARLIDSGKIDLSQIAHLSYEEAINKLQQIPGVGQKVADCVALFGLGFLNAFPIDVWVKRAVEFWYPHLQGSSLKGLRIWASQKFYPFAGYVQQYLYEWARKFGSKWKERGNKG